jgi:hypothetical protein
MEFVPRSLLDILEGTNDGHGLPADWIRSILFQISKAMTFIHKQVCISGAVIMTCTAHSAVQIFLCMIDSRN